MDTAHERMEQEKMRSLEEQGQGQGIIQGVKQGKGVNAYYSNEHEDNDMIIEHNNNNNNFFLSKKPNPKPKKVIPIEAQNSNIDSIRQVYNRSPLLEIEVTNSSTIPKGTIFKINPLGMENSLRKANDGYTYFGFEQESKGLQSSSPSSTIDYSIKPKEANYEERYIGLHFQIFFNPMDLKYYISDLGYGFGTFRKISTEVEIAENTLVNVGNSYLVFSYKQDDQGLSEQSSFSLHTLPLEKGERNLHLKVFSGHAKYEPFVFYPKLNKVVYIGRDTECNVMIDDSLLSRFQCTLEYQSDGSGTGTGNANGSNNGKWVIKDGKIKAREIKLSTNGTWIYLMEDTVITDNMVFKGNQNVFKCHYTKPIN